MGLSVGAIKDNQGNDAIVKRKISFQMRLFIRTIGLARAEAKLILANLAYNFDRLIFHERRAAMG